MVRVDTRYSTLVSFEQMEPKAGCLHGISCLLVMRSSDQRLSLASNLEDYGALLFQSEEANEASVMLKNFRPDLVLCASNLAFDEGLLFISFLRSLPANQGGDLPVIAIEPEASTDAARSALIGGYDLYLTESVVGSQLILQLSKLVQNWL